MPPTVQTPKTHEAGDAATSPRTPGRSRSSIDNRTLMLLAAQWTLFAGNFAVWLSGASPFPIWVHTLIGFVPIHLAFTIWHEAAHGNVSRNRRLNHIIGIVAMIPYLTPYYFQRYVHLDHHKYLNVEGEDPNLIYADGPFWQMPLRYVRALRYARRKLEFDPRSPGMRRTDRAVGAVLVSVWIAAFATGHGLDIVALWLVPFVVAKVVMDWYVNFLPHIGLPAHRYLGTRVVEVAWLTPLVLQHNYHAIHHLWPGIPWHRYRETYREKHDFLVERGVPIEHAVFTGRTFPELPPAPAPTPTSTPKTLPAPPPQLEAPEAS